MKLAVIGSRNLNICLEKHMPKAIDLIISGGAGGIDKLAEAYADQNNIQKLIIKPDFKKYGRLAPLVRNKEIAKLADLIIAFWDGKSKGTEYTINFAKSIGKKVVIHRVTSLSL